MQRLGGGDDIEMTRQEWQRLDLADDVQASAEAGREASDKLDRSIDAEDLMTGIAQHRGESAAARPEIEDPHGLLADHPNGRSLWIRISPRRHGGNFNGA
jgi:hypothetical protein